MARKIRSVELSALNHLAGILRSYLEGKITDTTFEGQVIKAHSITLLRQVLEDERFSYPMRMNPEKLVHIRSKFGI